MCASIALALLVAGCGPAPEARVITLGGSGTPGNTDGPALQAQFRAPEGITVDADGNIIVADTGNYRIRKIVIR